MNFSTVVVFVIVILSFVLFGTSGIVDIFDYMLDPRAEVTEPIADSSEVSEKKAPKLPISGLKTNTLKSEIDLDLVLSGGPGKDGIPAINNPKFETLEESDTSDDVWGILVEFDGEKRYYPYNILVWHEIVNDSIGNNHFAVTFCPLCGTAILFDRNVDGEIVRFGVSGLLYESNLLMYDDKTESLWSQAIGRAVIGDKVRTDLVRLPMQLIDFATVKEKHSDAKVLSTSTGHFRNYSYYPYGDYESSERLVFPVSVDDKRFHAKELMYVVNVNDKSVAFVRDQIPEGETSVEIANTNLVLKRDGGEITVKKAGELVPGYYEMWFSWATHHQEDGVVWEG